MEYTKKQIIDAINSGQEVYLVDGKWCWPIVNFETECDIFRQQYFLLSTNFFFSRKIGYQFFSNSLQLIQQKLWFVLDFPYFCHNEISKKISTHQHNHQN